MLHLSDLQGKPVSEQLFAFADANLGSASLLCLSLSTGVEGKTYAHGAVVLSLTFHALELFLKAALLQKSPAERFVHGHNLSYLFERYLETYPDAEASFENPFQSEELVYVEDLDPLVADELRAAAKQQDKSIKPDQVNRYPVDSAGQPWPILSGFEARLFMATIQKLEQDFLRVRQHLAYLS